MHAWEKFVESQEVELGIQTTQKWLKTLSILRFDACNLYLEAQDAFQAIWFEEHIRPKLSTGLVNNHKKRIKVHLSIANELAKAKGRASKAKPRAEPPTPSFSLSFDEIDPQCTFSTFVVSTANELAYQVVARAIGELPTKDAHELLGINPIYIYGSPGVGKTHLLMAAANALKAKEKHVIYSSAQTFTDHVVSAIRAGEMHIFRQAYRNSDVLIIDDAQIFSRKGATQEEFFHTFNTLHTAGKQIILGANCLPGELQLIEPRLISRFEWGIVLGLELPSQEESVKILEKMSASMNFPLHQKVMEFLVESFSNGKSLSKALKTIILRAHLHQGKNFSSAQITVPVAKQILGDLLKEELSHALTPERIVAAVAESFGIRSEDIFGKAQTRDCVLPRQISMYLCRHQLKMPYTQIGELFEKNHSTVMSSVKLIQKEIDSDTVEIGSTYRMILKKIRN